MSNTAVAFGIRPHLRRVAGDEQQVAQPDRRRAQQVAQHAEQVAVAAAVVRHRLDADLLLDQQRSSAARPCGSARAGRRARSPRRRRRACSCADVGEHPRRVDAARRHDLHRRDELACARSSPPNCERSASGTGSTSGARLRDVAQHRRRATSDAPPAERRAKRAARAAGRPRRSRGCAPASFRSSRRRPSRRPARDAARTSPCTRGSPCTCCARRRRAACRRSAAR